MRILVTGASGYLGWHLVRRLESSHEVTAACGSNPVAFARARTTSVDLSDPASIRALARTAAPDSVIHAAAITDVGACQHDPAVARRVNTEGTASLLAESRRANPDAGFVLVSTDLVFDGAKPGGMYEESDDPAPLMAYGETKLLAERAVLGAPGAVVLRSSLIYGPPSAPRPCFLEWMLAGLRAGTGSLFTDEFRSPVHVDDLAAAIEAVATGRLSGLFHAGGPERISRHQFGRIAAQAHGLPAENARPARQADVVTTTPRPADVSMDSRRLAGVTGLAFRDCREGLRGL